MVVVDFRRDFVVGGKDVNGNMGRSNGADIDKIDRTGPLNMG